MSPAFISLGALPSARVTVARPLIMWQYSPADVRSAVKWPGLHSHTPILQ